ncbi:PLP-dependent transferase [Kribbella sandramycini]|uniref:homocysteine desulfhydrase n=1 Tax=Kribbella sandramycini TaxID=60450 RepID=A0A7Y4KZS8_9ACTN|nr:PLP-dependent aspartate aminotransferase family protein [Kribbella sandramycini]MBB6565410.1 cystathionine beta-lyase/cystathionine gamma-synthase [Kribbella sandramycini]NOL41678.1 PLP-dependent transferase [Kribbella sandramycini]
MTQLDTRSVHAGRDDLTALGVHVPPIDLSTTYPLPDVHTGGASYDALAQGNGPDGGSLVYQRLWNPTVARFEEALAELEHTDGAVAFGTGMAALAACLLGTVAVGKPHVIAVRPLYGGSDHLLSTGLLGTTVSWVAVDEIAAAVRPDTGLVIVETPANPTLELIDIAAVVRQAGDVPVLVDSTFATPVLQQPARHGASLVLHSATKYLGGHGDVMGGVVAGSREWVGRLRQIRAVTGGLLHPLAAYELHRGLQTLPVRVRAQQATAAKVADWLCAQPAVEQVYYPGLSDPQELIGRQQSGPGAIVAFTVAGGYEAAAQVAGSLRLITHAVSLGGVDTLIQHPAALTHRLVADDAKPSNALLRLSLGLEDPEDITADLLQAFSRVLRPVG